MRGGGEGRVSGVRGRERRVSGVRRGDGEEGEWSERGRGEEGE